MLEIDGLLIRGVRFVLPLLYSFYKQIHTMNIIQLYDIVGNYAKGLTNVNNYSTGDVYTNWNSKEIRYASVNMAIESIEEYEEHQVYNAIIYYGDRLVEGGNNKYQVQTEAVRLLKDIVKHLRETDNMD